MDLRFRVEMPGHMLRGRNGSILLWMSLTVAWWSCDSTVHCLLGGWSKGEGGRMANRIVVIVIELILGRASSLWLMTALST